MIREIPEFDIQLLRGRLQAAEAFARTSLKGAEEENSLFEPTRKLLAVHQEIRDLLCDESSEPEPESEKTDECAVVNAAIEIEKEEHTLKADAKDILKAFFMWKDDPEERASKS